jgi:hypothetical protein
VRHRLMRTTVSPVELVCVIGTFAIVLYEFVHGLVG